MLLAEGVSQLLSTWPILTYIYESDTLAYFSAHEPSMYKYASRCTKPVSCGDVNGAKVGSLGRYQIFCRWSMSLDIF